MQDTNDWKKSFFRLQENNNVTEAYSLKLSNFPSKFYKYRSLNDYTFDSLSNSEVYLDCASNQNDPYDSCYTINFIEVARSQYKTPNFWTEFKSKLNIEMPQEYINEIVQSANPVQSYIEYTQKFGLKMNASPDLIISQKHKKWKELVEIQRKKIKISCFSTRNDSVLMWSHYAGKHQGVCVEYDFTADIHTCEIIQPVQYQNEQYDMTAKMIPHLSASNISLGTYIATLTKAKDWEYEHEWRILKNVGASFHTVPKPTAIYIGTQFEKNEKVNQDRILSIALKAGIPVFKMKVHHSKYLIEPALEP